ncbi:hypothetical protein V2J09_013819 [Rumex salicifolius]
MDPPDAGASSPVVKSRPFNLVKPHLYEDPPQLELEIIQAQESLSKIHTAIALITRELELKKTSLEKLSYWSSHGRRQAKVKLDHLQSSLAKLSFLDVVSS